MAADLDCRWSRQHHYVVDRRGSFSVDAHPSAHDEATLSGLRGSGANDHKNVDEVERLLEVYLGHHLWFSAALVDSLESFLRSPAGCVSVVQLDYTTSEALFRLHRMQSAVDHLSSEAFYLTGGPVGDEADPLEHGFV